MQSDPATKRSPTSPVREETIAALIQRFGWKAFVTNAPRTRLSLQAVVLCYRNSTRRTYLQSPQKPRPYRAALFVKLNEQIEASRTS